MSCQHEEFRAAVAVGRMTPALPNGEPNEDAGPRRFVAEVTINCAGCGDAFAFEGLPVGLSSLRPTTNLDGTELRAPLTSPAELELRAMIEAEEGTMLDPPVTLQTARDLEERALELLPASLRRVQVLSAHPETGHVTLVLRWRDGMKLGQRRRAEAYLLGEMMEQVPVNVRLHLESINPQEAAR